MKILSKIKRIILSVCAVICGVSCVGAVAVTSAFSGNGNQVVTNAETVASASVSGWSIYGSSTNLHQVSLNFEGFKAYNSDATADPTDSTYDFIYNYIKINGKTIKEINTTTDTSGWEWTWSTQKNNDNYKKPIVLRIQKTEFQLRIHDSFYQAAMASDGKFVITYDKDLTVAGYVVDGETSYALSNGTWSKVETEEIKAPVTVEGWSTYSTNLLRFSIKFAGINAYKGDATADPTDSTYDFIYNYIKINGKTLSEINATTDVSGWTWLWSSQQSNDNLKKPAIMRIQNTEFQLRMHENFYNAVMASDGKFVVTFDEAFTVAGYVADREISYQLDASNGTWSEVVLPKEAPVTVSGWAAYTGNLTQLTINFAGINAYNSSAAANPTDPQYSFVYNYIKINGKTLSEINEGTDTSGWTWDWNVQTTEPDYQKPAIMRIYEDKFLLRIHNNFYNAEMASAGRFVITIDKEFSVAGYVADKETSYVLSGDTWNEIIKAPASVSGWSIYGSSTNLHQVSLNFEGFKAYNSDATADPTDSTYDFIYNYIKINGKTIKEINTTTDTSGWEWTWSTQKNNDNYKKPIVLRIQKTEFQLRIHDSFYQAAMASDGKFVITFDKSLMLAGYTVDKETSYLLNGSTWEETTWVDSVKASISVVENMNSVSGTLYEYLIYFEGFNETVNYDQPAADDYVFRNMYLNGVSIHDINATMDVSGWGWDKYPQVNYGYLPQYRLPVISCIDENAAAEGLMELRIHKNLINELLLRDGEVILTVSEGFGLNNCVLEEETNLELVSLKETELSVVSWVKYKDASLYALTLEFAGFNKKYDYVGAAISEYVLGNILINGRSISEINQNTNVNGWVWEIFPQPNDAIYQKAILPYMNGEGMIELRIHKNLYDQIIANYGALEVSVSENFLWNGYIDRDGAIAIKKSDDTFVTSRVVVDANEISVSRWSQVNELSYFDIVSSKLFTGWGYEMHENSRYDGIADLIRINGRSLKDINATTDVSGWEWKVFPSTVAAAYQKPIVAYAGNEYNSAGEYEGKQGTLELRIHDNYWNTIKDEGLIVTLPGGYYFEIGGTMYVLNDTVDYKKDPSINGSTETGGFETIANPNDFQMVDGASIRMKEGSSGIRFTAKVAQSYLDALTAAGKTYRLMMEVTRENGKTVQLNCTNSYEEKGYIVYNVAIVNLAESSYTLTYTAKPYIEITDNGVTKNMYTDTISVSRTINDIAYSAYIDISETYDEEKYPYEIIWEGKTQYSPYTSRQRELLASYVKDAVLLSDGVYKFVNESNDNFLMLSDNAQVNAFFEEYADRFVYYYKNLAESEDCITDTVVGNASMSWKDWEAESILFMDSLHLNGNDQQFGNDIAGAKVDKYGYVWEGDSYFGQGWNSPSYIGSRETTGDPYLSDGWEFVDGRKNSSILAVDQNASGSWGASDRDWTVSGDGSFFEFATVPNGIPGSAENGYFIVNTQNASYVTYSLQDSSNNGVLQAAHAPFVEIGLEWLIAEGSVSEIYLEFKSASKLKYTSLALSQWATTAIDFTQDASVMHLYVPVFENTNWTGKIEGLRVKVEGSFTGYIYLDYVRGAYDTRMIDTNTSFISAGRQHFENTGDVAFLQANINNYRKALMFLTNYMSDNGLINLANLVGHNGSAQGFATSLISTYWDIVSLAPNSSYVNALYYKALLNMAYLEDALTANNIVVAAPTVKTTLTGKDITYNYTASSLRSMAATVKTAVSANLNESAKTGYFKTFNVTINGETMEAGRFIEGYYGDTQIDFGAVALNLMILESGVATAEQEEKVLNWIASIDNLYEYVFAPKTNTEDLENQYCWAYAAANYGVSCQNGGAILFVSYYDILARAKVFGAENAFERLSEIMEWFADVQAAFEKSGETDAKNFFLPYYENSGLTLQGRNEEGSLGLHAEFIENAILYAAVPNAFFGMNTYYGADGLVMQIEPNLPEEIGTWKMEQVRYAGLVYDVAIGNNFVLVCNVEEKESGALSKDTKLEVTLSYEGETPKVYVNNKLVSEGYTVDVEAKTVTVTVDFTNVNISVR